MPWHNSGPGTVMQSATSFCSAARVAVAFSFYGLMAIGLLAINTPPFQVPDEFAHFLRAAQIADGVLVATRVPMTKADGTQRMSAGGLIDPNFWKAAAPFDTLPFHPDVRATGAYWAPNIRWSEERILGEFPNTANYPPFLYVPAAIGVLAGRAANLSIVRTLIIARLLTGVTAVAIGAVAIAIAGGAAPWIFTILTMPMALSLLASASQDALLLACSALAGALVVRGLRWPDTLNPKVLVIGLTVALGLAAMARPPYGALAILPLGLGKVRWRWRILAAIAIAACVMIWSAVAVATTYTDFYGPAVGANPVAQLARLRGDPLLIASVAWSTLTQYWNFYLIEFVGQLGWLDTPLPYSYHSAARVMLVVGAVTSMLTMRGDRITACSFLIVVVGVLVSAIGVFGIQYMTWTPPGNSTVTGVQGRYFLPLALVSAALLPALAQTRLARLRGALLIVVLGFPLVSLAVVMRTLVLRYYIG